MLFYNSVLTPLISQDSTYIQLDTFSSKKHSGEDFATAIKSLRKSYINKEEYETISSFDQYMDSLLIYTFQDQVNLRKAYTYHARRHEKYRGDYLKARHYYTRAHEILDKDQYLTDTWMWYIENPLGNLYTRLGDYEKAEYFHSITVKALLHQGKKGLASRSLNNLGLVYQSNENFCKAVETYRRGIDMAVKAGNTIGEIVGRVNLVASYIQLSEFSLVEKEIFKLVKNIEALDEPEYMESVYWLKADFATAKKQYEKAIDYRGLQKPYLDNKYANQERREFGKFYFSLGKDYLHWGKPKMAIKQVKEGLRTLILSNERILKEDIYAENTFYELYEVYGDAYRLLYEETLQISFLDSALYCYNHAFHAIDLLQEKYMMEGSKLVSALPNKRIVNRMTEVLFLLQESGQEISDEMIKECFIRSKGLILKEQLNFQQQFLGLTSVAQDQYRKNQKEMVSIQQDLEKNVEQINNIHQLKEANLAILDNSKVIIENTYFQGAVLEFLVTENDVYSYDNFSGKERFLKLCTVEDLEVNIDLFFSLIQEVEQQDSLDIINTKLYTLLFQKLTHIPAKFSIIPDEKLTRIPFEILMDYEGNYLLGNHEIDFRYGRLIRKRDVKRITKIHCVLPDYGEAQHDLLYERSDIYPLKYAVEEVKNITEVYDDVIVKNTLSREDLESIFTMDVFHYAGHSRTNENRGYLVVNKDVSKPFAKIMGEDIALIPSELQLAVLSACETGTGKMNYGEGEYSLARSFIEGGTSSVISSLWTVNDQTTSKIMAALYRGLHEGNSSSTALRKAKMDYLSTAQGVERHPYYWAGFILTTSIDTSSDQSYSFYAWIAFAVGICMIFIYVYKTKFYEKDIDRN